jgi:hypothetical protein
VSRQQEPVGFVSVYVLLTFLIVGYSEVELSSVYCFLWQSMHVTCTVSADSY